MWQAMIGKAIAGGAQAWNAAMIGRAQVRAANRVARANATAQNRVRHGQNALQASVNSLARFQQASNNRRSLEAMGEQVTAQLVTAARTEDALLSQGFEAAIQQSEQDGMAAAMAAASGAGGSVVDDVNGATALRFARAKGAAKAYENTVLYDTAVRAASIQEQTQSSLASGLIFDNLDYTINAPQIQAEPNVTAQTLLGAADAIFGSHGAGPGGIGMSNEKSQDAQPMPDQTDAETARLNRYAAAAQLQEDVQREQSIQADFNASKGQEIWSQYLSIGST